MSAFDFGGWLVEEILDNEEAALRRDADCLAEDGRKIMGDLREAERRVHEQG